MRIFFSPVEECFALRCYASEKSGRFSFCHCLGFRCRSITLEVATLLVSRVCDEWFSRPLSSLVVY